MHACTQFSLSNSSIQVYICPILFVKNIDFNIDSLSGGLVEYCYVWIQWYFFEMYFIYRHPRFIQGSQEDSHEMLRSLLDVIKTEEIEVERLGKII